MTGGVNHIDTCSSWRNQRSERVVGMAIRALIEKYGFERNEFFVNVKQGFLEMDDVTETPL